MQTMVDYAGSKGTNDVTLDFSNPSSLGLYSTPEGWGTMSQNSIQLTSAQKMAATILHKRKSQPERHVVIIVTGKGFDEDERIFAISFMGSRDFPFRYNTFVPLSLVGQKPQHPMTKVPLFAKQGDGDVGLAYQYLYTFGYNDSVFVRRVHNIISAVEQARQAYRDDGGCKITLIALDGAGKWAALAASQLGGKVDSLVIDTAGFRFENIDAVDDPDFLPGGAKYFDLPGMIALCAPTPMLLLGEAETPEVVAAAYKAAGAESAIQCLGNAPMTLDEKIALIAERLSE
jgi:hypothetical protein